MTSIAIKDFKIKQSYTKLIDDALFSYLWEGIYKPMFEIMQIKPPVARNSADDVIITALREGKIYYVDGGFKAKNKFTNAMSEQLIKWGARYDSRSKIFRISYENIPTTIKVALADIQNIEKQKLQLLELYIKEVQANLPYIIESWVFNEEVITILDDAQNEVKKNVKHLNIIEPELSQEQKQEIAQAYTENIRGYAIKDFDEKIIPSMRERVQELVLQGARYDEVQKMMEREFNIASNKAKFLARNETGIMLAEYKKVTYKEMGFDKFIWMTVMDGRERELHKQLNNTTWYYDDPPVIDERTGQRGLPQQTYNCRCDAVPFRDDTPFNHHNISTPASEKKINGYLQEVKTNRYRKVLEKG